MRTGLARVAAAAALALVSGCASASPVVEVGAAPADAGDTSAAAETMTTMMTELTVHFLGAAGGETSIISDGATVDVAVTELAGALPLGEGAVDFAAATAFELARTAAAGATVTDVELVPGEVSVVGGQDGDTVATFSLLQRTTRDSGPITEVGATYALLVDGDRLDDVLAWDFGLDSGVGLASPTGAAQRFIDLVRADDLDAVAYFSGGVNTSEAELAVLRTAVENADVHLAEVPQFRSGSTRVVYALDGDARVLARFEVTLDATTTVVYAPTS